MDFNRHSRRANALMTSGAGLVQQMVQILGNFVYRTVFLMFLSKEYLGIQGLFSNILQLFSLAELGIGSAILYSMYKPFATGDTPKIGALVGFYSRVYHMLAVLVAVLGLCFYPFISSVVDLSQIPPDVNLTRVYFLFVAQSAMSYLFVYRQSLLTADQKNYLVLLFTGGLLLASYALRTAVLIATRNFEAILLADILVSLVLNFLFSRWISRRYRDVFRQKGRLPKADRREILHNTGGLLCHKIGTIVVTSTDNIVLSKYVSLAAVGIYSNYATIVSAITNLVVRVIASLVPTVTNYILTKTREETRTLFRRFLFANLWLASFTTVCLYLLLNPFIEIWLDGSFLLPEAAVAWICMQHYLLVARITANNFVTGCGLFARDRARPIVESVINIVVSVALAKTIGIAGVFIGTCVSGLCTYFWREPYLVFRNYLKTGFGRYWVSQGLWLALTLGLCAGGRWLFGLLPGGIGGFALKLLVAAVVPNAVILGLTFRLPQCRYFLGTAARMVKNKLRT